MSEPPAQPAPLHPMPRISVVVPVFNGGSGLDRCLAAIAASGYPDFECIVVDDGSTDGAVAPAAIRHGARSFRLQQRKGPACARNRGAAEASGEILFFTDADVLLHPDALSVAADTLQSDPQLSAVIGSYDDQPGHASFLSQYRNLYHHWVHQNGNTDASTFWTGCGAIRRRAFLDLGGFRDSYLRPSIEDIEFGYRLRQSGHRIRLERTMLGKHMKVWTLGSMLRTDLFQRGVPWVSLLMRAGPVPRDLNLGSSSRIATVLAGLFMVSLLFVPMAGRAAATGKATALLLTGLPPGLLLGIILAELPFYQFLVRQRGVCFALAVVPMRLLFFLVCAAAIPLGLFEYLRDTRAPRPRRA